MAQEIGLHTLKPKAGSRHRKKRVGRGEGSGMRQDLGPRREGRGLALGREAQGQLRGRPDADPHAAAQAARPAHEEVDAVRAVRRTQTQPVNLKDLEARFDSGAEVTPETLREKGLATRKDIPVKILGEGDLGKKLTIRVHYASKSAREKIEGAGGTLELLVEPKKPKPAKQKPAPPAEPVAEAEPEEAPDRSPTRTGGCPSAEAAGVGRRPPRRSSSCSRFSRTRSAFPRFARSWPSRPRCSCCTASAPTSRRPGSTSTPSMRSRTTSAARTSSAS